MNHRRYRGPAIEHTEGFHDTNNNGVEWKDKEKFLEELGLLEGKSRLIRYFGGNEIHYKGWRWPCDLANKIREQNFKPSHAFINMVKQEVHNDCAC